MSQFDTSNAAIRFVYVSRYASVVKECSIHDSEGVAVHMVVASGVIFNQNIIYRTRRNAILVRSGRDIQI